MADPEPARDRIDPQTSETSRRLRGRFRPASSPIAALPNAVRGWVAVAQERITNGVVGRVALQRNIPIKFRARIIANRQTGRAREDWVASGIGVCAIHTALARADNTGGEDKVVVGIICGSDCFDDLAIVRRRQTGGSELRPVHAVIDRLIDARPMSRLLTTGRDHLRGANEWSMGEEDIVVRKRK